MTYVLVACGLWLLMLYFIFRLSKIARDRPDYVSKATLEHIIEVYSGQNNSSRH